MIGDKIKAEYTFKNRKYGFFVHFVHGLAQNADGSAAFTYFEGDCVEIFGNLRWGNGKAKVYIDGVFAGEIDENAPTAQNRVPLFASIDLHGGIHTLYIVTTTGAPFELDAIKITK